MTLTVATRIIRNRKAQTHYLTIPAVLTQDSAYPFKDATEVVIEIIPEKRQLIVRLPLQMSPSSKKK